MPLVLHYAARSDVGRVRAKNDDSAYVGRHLAVLADGMGGHVGGDVASASTVLDLAPLDDVGYEDPATVLPDEIQNANLILNELVHANPKLAGMGTTCTAALLAGTSLHMAHIGDSRAYRLQGGELEQVTRDHTFVQRLVDEGRLEASEAQHHPNKNVLMRVLGDVDASPELDVFEVPVEVGERWLFCSDGLTDVLSVERIRTVLAESEALNTAVDTLVELSLKGGAPDNVTVIVFEIAEGTPDELAPIPEVHLSEEALAAARPADIGPVSGRLLREDLDVRPHLLVGAASSAVKTDRLPVVTRSSTRRRAAALLGERPVPENRPRRVAAVPTEGADESPVESAATAPAAAAGSTSGASAVPGGSPDSTGAPRAPGPDDGVAVSRSQHRATAGATVAPAAGPAPATPDTTTSDTTTSDTAGPSAAAPLDADTSSASPRRDGPAGERTAGVDVPVVQYRRGWFIPVFTTLLALTLGAVLLWGYLWTQTQYYVGEADGAVAVYKGVPQHLGPLDLSEVDRRTDLSVDRLPSYAQERVRDGMAARDLDHAEQIVTELQDSLSAPADQGQPDQGQQDQPGGSRP